MWSRKRFLLRNSYDAIHAECIWSINLLFYCSFVSRHTFIIWFFCCCSLSDENVCLQPDAQKRNQDINCSFNGFFSLPFFNIKNLVLNSSKRQPPIKYNFSGLRVSFRLPVCIFILCFPSNVYWFHGEKKIFCCTLEIGLVQKRENCISRLFSIPQVKNVQQLMNVNMTRAQCSTDIKSRGNEREIDVDPLIWMKLKNYLLSVSSRLGRFSRFSISSRKTHGLVKYRRINCNEKVIKMWTNKINNFQFMGF